MQEQKTGIRKPADLTDIWVKVRPGWGGRPLERQSEGHGHCFNWLHFLRIEMKYVVWQRANPFKQEECTALKSEGTAKIMGFPD